MTEGKCDFDFVQTSVNSATSVTTDYAEKAEEMMEETKVSYS